MKKVIISWILGLWVITIFFSSPAQDIKADTLQNLTLQQALDTGLKNRLEVRNQQISFLLAGNELSKIKSKGGPQINMVYDSRINPQLQTNYIPIKGPGTDAVPITLGKKYYNGLSVNATQNLYNSANAGDRKISEARIELEQQNLDKIRIDIRLSISQSFYNAMVSKEKMNLSQFNVAQAHEFFLRGKEQQLDGTLSSVDLERLELDEYNTQLAYENDKGNYQLSINQLIHEIGLPAGVNIGSLAELNVALQDTQMLHYADTVTPSRIELKQEQTQLKINMLNIKKQQLGYLPNVSLYGNYTVQQYNTTFDPTFGKLWNPYNYAGIRIEMALFDGLTKERTKQEFRFRAEQNKNNLIKLRNDIRYEVNSAMNAYSQCVNNYHYSRRNYELAKKLAEVDQTRFKEGTITTADLKNTAFSLQNAQANYLTAIYNYYVALLNYQKASGEL